MSRKRQNTNQGGASCANPIIVEPDPDALRAFRASATALAIVDAFARFAARRAVEEAGADPPERQR